MKVALIGMFVLAIWPALACVERVLSGAKITQLLTGAEVIGRCTRQTFHKSGGTHCNDGNDCRGHWTVEGG